MNRKGIAQNELGSVILDLKKEEREAKTSRGEEFVAYFYTVKVTNELISIVDKSLDLSEEQNLSDINVMLRESGIKGIKWL